MANILLSQKQYIPYHPTILRCLTKLLHKSHIDKVDAMTDFTDNILRARQLKEEIRQLKYIQSLKSKSHSEYLIKAKNFLNLLKYKKSIANSNDVLLISVDFETMNENHIDNLLVTACHDKNSEFIEKFIEKCIVKEKRISENSLLNLCQYLSSYSLDIDQSHTILLRVIEFSKVNNQLFYIENCEFAHYIANSLWRKGNSNGALLLFEKTYEIANDSVKMTIRSMFKSIIEDTVSKKSEAVLLRLIKTAVMLQEKMNESAILTYVWQTCFFSLWFSDQVVAEELFQDYMEVRITVARRRGIFCYIALERENVDLVHRLIQLFLKHNMISECKQIFGMLFEYQYSRKDLRACSEIIRTSLELDLNLCNTYNVKLLNLLMSGSCKIQKPKQYETPKFNLKF